MKKPFPVLITGAFTVSVLSAYCPDTGSDKIFVISKSTF